MPLLPNNVGKKSANDAGPKQGHDTYVNITIFTPLKKQYRFSQLENLELTKSQQYIRI